MRDAIDRLNTALTGRYSIERELGEGGMATVYLGHDQRHDRAVAVKVLKPELAAAIGAERFLAEIRTTARLQHPHILPLFDSGEADGLLFYVMPYVQGESFDALLERTGALSVDRAVEIARQLAHALQHAHEQGIVHRDIKPANVLLSDGEALLADFGIALTLGEHRQRLTQTGLAVGTPAYMSPEQATGAEVTARSDVFSLGALTYHMLAGAPPFDSESMLVSLGRLVTDGPPDVSATNPTVPGPLAAVVARALAAEPEDRPDSAAAFADELAAVAAPAPRRAVRRSVLVGAGALAVVAVALAAYGTGSIRQERQARNEMLPEVQRLLADGRTAEAFDLALRVQEVIPDDPLLADLMEGVAAPVDFLSEPEGARVLYRPYDRQDSVWIQVGVTPITDALLPLEELLVRYELEGFQAHTASLTPSWGISSVRLTPSTGEELVRVPAGSFGMTGEDIPIDAFEMDRHEVTNARYQQFLNAGLAWQPELWLDPLTSRGIEPDVERMRSEFVDATGRPGPAGWELSRYPDGADRLPVQGVSWFEAIAYCAFRGMELPTYYHWKQADGGSLTPWDGLLQHANIAGGQGPVPVGAAGAYSMNGVADLAGNVREWVWNAAGQNRYVLGGAWESPLHLYLDYDATDPWSRSMENGFRCARYETDPEPELLNPIELPIFDFTGYEPVDDETYRSFLTFYEYDRAPLNETREGVRETPFWRREYVEIDAAYSGERIPVHMFLPTNAEPPYQSVVYMPGGGAFVLASSQNTKEMAELEFVPRSGRAILFPVINGTYERRRPPPQGMADRRRWYVTMVQDIMRTVDFIEEQPDLDADRIAFMGLSFGAELAVPVAVEKRFAATILVGAALDPAWVGRVPEETAPWNFVSRITTPSIVINGEYDFMHPYEESQIPFFDMIDVEDKELVVLPTGHVPPNNEVIGHALRWLDRTLGPVSIVGTR